MVSNKVYEKCPRLGFIKPEDAAKLRDDFKANLNEHGKHVFSAGEICFTVKGDEIFGIEHRDGEKIVFEQPILIEEPTEDNSSWLFADILQACVSSSHDAVKTEIDKAMNVEGGSIELLNSGCIYQAIEVVDLIRNTRDTEAAGEKGADALKEYLDKLNAKLDMLSKETLKEMTDGKRKGLGSLITLNVNHRNLVKDILARVCEIGQHGFQEIWHQQLRHYYQEGGVKVRCDAYEINYKYEYLGVDSKLVITPLTRRAYQTLARGMYQGSGVGSAGPAGTGKTETAKDFYKNCGRYFIVINCSDQLDADTYGKILTIADMANACMIFDEFNRTPSAVFEEALPAFAKHAAKKQSGIAVTFNPNFAGRYPIPQKFWESFSHLTMVFPDFVLIYQVMMHNQGLGLAADDLAVSFWKSMEALKNKCSKQHQYDFGMRAGKSMTVHTGKLCRSGASPADCVVTAFHANMASMFTKEDMVVFQAVMAENFPGANVLPLDQEFAAKFAAAQPDASDFTKCKAQQIYSKSRLRHCMMVMGTESKIIEDVVGAMGGSCSIIDASMDMATFYEKTLKDEFIKAAGCENHWVIIKEQSDTNWPVFYENMNQVADDNRKLVLPTHEIIPMPPTMRIVGLVQRVCDMTPATVSRNGIINMAE